MTAAGEGKGNDSSAECSAGELQLAAMDRDLSVNARSREASPLTSLDALSASTLQREDVVREKTAPLQTVSLELLNMRQELQRLSERLKNEEERTQEMESTKRLIDIEYESLSVHLFEEANLLVRQERIQRSEAEKRTVILEQRLRDSDTVVDSLQCQLAELKELLLRRDNEDEVEQVTQNDDAHMDDYPYTPTKLTFNYCDPLNATSPTLQDKNSILQPSSPLVSDFPESEINPSAFLAAPSDLPLYTQRSSSPAALVSPAKSISHSRNGSIVSSSRNQRGNKPRLGGDNWKADMFPISLDSGASVLTYGSDTVDSYQSDGMVHIYAAESPRRQSAPGVFNGIMLGSTTKLSPPRLTPRKPHNSSVAVPGWANFALGPHEADFITFINIVLAPVDFDNSNFTTSHQKETVIANTRYMRRIYSEDIETTINFESPTWLQKKKLMSAITSHQLVITTRQTALFELPPQPRRKFSVASVLVGGSLTHTTNSNNTYNAEGNGNESLRNSFSGSHSPGDSSVALRRLRCFGCNLAVRNEPPLYTIRLTEGEDDRIVCEGCHARLLAACQFYSYIRMLVVGVLPSVGVDNTVIMSKPTPSGILYPLGTTTSSLSPVSILNSNGSHYGMEQNISTSPIVISPSVEQHVLPIHVDDKSQPQQNRAHNRQLSITTTTSTSPMWTVNSERSPSPPSHSSNDDEIRKQKRYNGIPNITNIRNKHERHTSEFQPPEPRNVQNRHVLHTVLWLDICKLRQRMFLARIGVSLATLDSTTDSHPTHIQLTTSLPSSCMSPHKASGGDWHSSSPVPLSAMSPTGKIVQQGHIPQPQPSFPTNFTSSIKTTECPPLESYDEYFVPVDLDSRRVASNIEHKTGISVDEDRRDHSFTSSNTVISLSPIEPIN